MLPHIKKLLDEAQNAKHYLHSVDGRPEPFRPETYWRAGDSLQAAIDEALKAEGLDENGDRIPVQEARPLLPDLPAFARSLPRPFSSRDLALEEREREVSALSNSQLATLMAEKEYTAFEMVQR